MLIASYSYELFADYHQFYLQDEEADGDLSDSWTEQATKDLIAVAPGTIGVGTVRDMDIPVIVEIHDTEPEDELNQWSHVTGCSIEVSSGKIVIAGCTDYFPDAARIEVPPGIYQARIYYGALDSLSDDGLEGDDNYKVALWLGEQIEPKVTKRCDSI